MGLPFNFSKWYVSLADTNPNTKLYSIERGNQFDLSDATLQAWLLAQPSGCWLVAGAVDNGAGKVRLTLTATGDDGGQPLDAVNYFVCYGVSGATGAQGFFQLTIISISPMVVDLVGSTFGGAFTTATQGVLGGPIQRDTASHIVNDVDSFGSMPFQAGINTQGGAKQTLNFAGGDITLTNPIGPFLQSLGLSANRNLTMPQMNLINSYPAGRPLYLDNPFPFTITLIDPVAGTVGSVAPYGAACITVVGKSINGAATYQVYPVVPGPFARAAALLGFGTIESAVSVDFSVAGDNAIPIVLPTGYTRYRINLVEISGASADISAATAGLFTAVAGGGFALVAAASAITVTASAELTANNMQNMTVISQNTQSCNAATLYWRVAATAAAGRTAKVAVVINPVS